MQFRRFTRAVEGLAALDPAAGAVQQSIRRLYAAGGETGLRLRDFLHGVWLGHPVHPILVAIPTGAWTAAAAFDAADALEGRRDLAPGADAAITVGILGAVGSAISGLTDWQHLNSPRGRRVGAVHALLNTVALGCYVGSLVYRLRGRRGPGQALAWAGFGTVSLAGYLGGELAYDQAVGVNHTALTEPATAWVPVLSAAALPDDMPRCVEANGAPVLLVRRHGQVHALDNVCAHLGAPLHEGKLDGDAIVCPWHGSRFCLDTGEVTRGPATYAQPRWETRVRHDTIEVRGQAAG